jgi:hypothetical protein
MDELAAAAFSHQDRLTARIDLTTRRALRAWARMDGADLDGSWDSIVDEIVRFSESAQHANAIDSTRYLNSVAQLDSVKKPDAPIVLEAFVGVDGSGRPIGSLLHGAVTTTKEQIGRGIPVGDSLLSGASYLAAMLKTSLADLARQSDMTAAANRSYTHYVRAVSAGACSRCSILAGKSSYKIPFKRHPACHCTAVPVSSGRITAHPGLFSSASDYFDSLSVAEQDRVFTQRGAEAIRAGADPAAVVSARKSATGVGYATGVTTTSRGHLSKTVVGYTAQRTPILGYVTSAGTSRRGQFGRINEALGGGNRVRLMPETIMTLASTPASARTLLRDAGYIGYPTTLNGADLLAAQRSDRQWADRIYRAAGYTI